MIKHYKTIVLSDIHLGTGGCKAKEVCDFLKGVSCDKLILNGDIIDGWQLKKYGKWKKQHTRFFKRILKMSEKHPMEIIYLRGNHDDFLDQIIPFTIGNIKIVRDYIHESNGKRYYVIHGDIFDSITTNLKWVAKLGDVGYTLLLWINQLYNQYRTKRGLPYYSLSQIVKAKVKKAVSYISDFEEQLAILAGIKNFDGIICGHIHQPAIKVFDKGILYLNSGDWVESLTALAENEAGHWEIIEYRKNQIADTDEEDEYIQEISIETIKKELITFRSLNMGGLKTTGI